MIVIRKDKVIYENYFHNLLSARQP